jgi:hypothetical protein
MHGTTMKTTQLCSMSKFVYRRCWRKGIDFRFVECQTVVTAVGPLSSNCYAPRHGFYTCSVFLIFFFFLFLPTSSSLATNTPTIFHFCNLLYSFSVCNVSTAVFVCLVRFSELTAIVSPSSITLTCGMVDFCNGECECLLWGRKWVFRKFRKHCEEQLSA